MIRRSSIKRVLSSTLAVTITTLAVVAVAATSVQAAPSYVGGRPANPRADNPRTNEIFIHTLNHGETASDGAVVVNNTDDQKVIKVYVTDGIRSSDGALGCREESAERTKVGAWVSLEQHEVTLEPRSRTVVNFTVTVPEGADVGEHNGCIVYQVKNETPMLNGNVRIYTRSATRISVTVPGDLRKNIDIASLTAENKKGTQHYRLTLKNTGNVSADTQAELTLNGLFGGEFYRNSGRYPILPDSEQFVPYTNEKPPIWGGWYWVNATIAYDKRPNTFGAIDKAHAVEKHADRQLVFIMPHPVVLLGLFGLVLILMSILFFVLYRRREKQDALRNWPIHTVKQAETIKSIADKQDIGWRKLAKLNDIKAPYTLSPGDKIRVPKKLPVASRKKIKIQ